jgi:hypothetical protein
MGGAAGVSVSWSVPVACPELAAGSHQYRRRHRPLPDRLADDFPTAGGIMGDLPEGEPFIVPLAVPLLAGPSTTATLLLLVRSEPRRLVDWLMALTVAWAITAAILLASTVIYRLLRQRGLIAMERLTGMLLVAVAVQMLLMGPAV